MIHAAYVWTRLAQRGRLEELEMNSINILDMTSNLTALFRQFTARDASACKSNASL